jgi:trimeric autotransporter adhesin
MGIRYAELTVPLIGAVKELTEENAELKAENELIRTELAEMKKMITQFGNDLSVCCTKNVSSEKANTPLILNGDAPFLDQNVPNPFSKTTKIQSYIPKNVKEATLQISDMNGNIVITQAITERGANTLELETGTLAQGTYFYSLILDNKVFATKKMILIGE